MKFLIVTLALVCAVYAQTDEDWLNYQKNFGKYYKNADDFADRRAKWEKNFRLIQEHNKEYEQGKRTYTLGENEFADMSYEEFAAQRLNFKSDFPRATEVHQVDETRELKSSYSLLNFEDKIKDQGSCGSCWAFASVAAVELAYVVKYGKKVDLSEQQLVDCNRGFLIFGNQGCNGGTFTPTFDYIKQKGLQTGQSYPYAEKENGKCSYDATKVVANTQVSSYVSTTTEKAITDAVALNNPVCVGIYVSSRFQLYKNGVYEPDSADANQNANHAVVVVGYNLSDAKPYYVIKNSWSRNWGENGYVNLRYGVNAIKITSMAVYPKL